MEMMQTKKQLNRVGKAGVMAGLLLMTAVAGATVGGMHLRVRADVEGAAQKLATADGPVRWDVGPKLIYAVDPEYPQAERKARVKKYVAQLQVSIGANGKVQDASVASGDRADFNEKAIEAVRAYRFKAAVLHGQPVACSVRIEVNFQLF
jgi:TonB family protein